MNQLPLYLVALLHFGQMSVELYIGQWAKAMIMVGFTIADIGMIWVYRQTFS